MFNRHFLILVVLGVMAFFVASPSAGAAELVGATNNLGSIKLRTISHSNGSRSLLLEFADARADNAAVIVGLAKGARVLDSFRLSYLDRIDDTEMTAETCNRPTGTTKNWGNTRGNLKLFGICSVDGPDQQITTFVVQGFHKRVKDFGTLLSGSPWDIFVSVIRSPSLGDEVPLSPFIDSAAPSFQNGDIPISACPLLTGAMRWSKYYWGSRKKSATHHFPLLFGSFTCTRLGIFGPGDHVGNPTNNYGRNVYIDTVDSDYGEGWRRVMGVLTQKPWGTFCYEFGPKGGSGGKTGISRSGEYQLTVIGPGLTPVVTTFFRGPDFAYGNDAYDVMTNKWGVNFSDGQVAALRQQAEQMGPGYKKKVKGSDCGKTLRQLPDSFFATN